MNLSDYVGRYVAMVGVIYGKGPSLFRHDFSQDTAFIKVAINDAGYVVPACDFLAMHDCNNESSEITRMTFAKSPDCNPILPFTDFPLVYPYMRTGTVWYKKDWALNPSLSYAVQNDMLYHGHCTAHSALHFLYIAGIRHVRLVGFDCVADDAHAAAHYPATLDSITKEAQADENHEKHATAHYTRYLRMLHGMALILGITLVEIKNE